MKVKDWVTAATKKLEASGIGSARLDSLILLEDAINKDRAYILAHPNEEIADVNELNKKIARRAKHEPLAYIRGFTEFYGRKFIVNKDVLEPRPESETMIELLLSLDLPAKQVIVDVGTGSGALAITAKLEIPRSKVVAIDIDSKCLSVAKQNAKDHKVELEFHEGDLMQPVLTKNSEAAVILANLPYVPDNYQINEAAAMEPRVAIFGGSDGLDLYRKMFIQIDSMRNKPKYILTESLPPQHEKLEQIATKSKYSLRTEQDFIQVFKY